jgi:hypothetical protein
LYSETLLSSRLKQASPVDADARPNAQREGHAWSTMARRLTDPSVHPTAAMTRLGEPLFAPLLVKPVLLDTRPEHINALLAGL